MPPGRPADAQSRRMAVILGTLAAHGGQGVSTHTLLRALGQDPASASDERLLARDLAALRDFGCLVVAESLGSESRFVLRVIDHRLRAAFSEVERRELLRAAQAGDLGQVYADLDPAQVGGAPADVDTDLGIALRAIEVRGRLTFEYAGRRRTVHPYDLELKSTGWRLRGREVDGHLIRVFALERAHDLGLDRPGTAEPVPAALPPLLADPMLRRAHAPVEVELRHAPELRGDVVAALGALTHRALPRDDSGLVGTVVTVTFLDAFLDRLLDLDQRAYLVGPAVARQALRDRLAGVLAPRVGVSEGTLPEPTRALDAVAADACEHPGLPAPTQTEAVSV